MKHRGGKGLPVILGSTRRTVSNILRQLSSTRPKRLLKRPGSSEAQVICMAIWQRLGWPSSVSSVSNSK